MSETASRDQRLATDACVWLATVRPDGRPHLTPIWFVWVAERFWLCTTATAVKVRNASHQPTVQVSLADPLQPVVAEATATLHRAPFPDAVVRAFSAKFDWDIAADDEGYDTLWELSVDRWVMG
jgi:hypothetical protein